MDRNDFTFAIQVDRSPHLPMAVYAERRHFHSITIELCRAETGEIKFFYHKMSNCLIRHISSGAERGEFPCQVIEINFGKGQTGELTAMVSKSLPFGERRLFERKSCSRMIHIKDSRDTYAGHMRDLALGGAFIEPPYDSDTRIGQELILTIPYGLKKDHLKIRARVARIQHGGIGVCFIKPTTEG